MNDWLDNLFGKFNPGYTLMYVDADHGFARDIRVSELREQAKETMQWFVDFGLPEETAIKCTIVLYKKHIKALA